MSKELETLAYISSIRELMINKIRMVFENEGLTSTEVMIIYLIQHKLDECKTGDLAAALYLPMSTMTGIIDKMVEKEIIVREHSEEDRRVIIIKLKPEFKTKAEQYMLSLEKTMKEITSTLEGQWYEDFKNKLKFFKEVLENRV